MTLKPHYDVVLVGAGLAGLTLARHLLRETDRTVLLIDRRASVPEEQQKVGEATVQLSGYYFAKVLDLEEHLLTSHLMKYNLRFYWRSGDRDNRALEDYTQAYIRQISNVPTYQLDRNALEAELLRLCAEDPRFQFLGGATPGDPTFAADGPHTLPLRTDAGELQVTADWIVDTSGGGRFLARKLDLLRPSPIHHDTFFMWVDGHLNIERLTDQPWSEVRLKRDRCALGHLPTWLATNHFCDEGLWFWVIPLRGKTSLGLVFDQRVVKREDVNTPEKLVAWVCERFPLFARDLPRRKILHFSGVRQYSHGCAQTISPERWAMSGISGRFLDPLYSPGSDFISVHNTLIVDAIKAPDRDALAERCRRAEQLMRALYEGFVPGFDLSYNALADAEAFSLKYTWELAVYFAFYVFPFINDLFTDAQFVPSFLRRFGKLGSVNHGLQVLLRDFTRWRLDRGEALRQPAFWDFTNLPQLQSAENTFYQVGLDAREARGVLDRQLASLLELARWTAAWVASRVLDDPRALTDRAFVEGLDLDALRFEPDAWRAALERVADSRGDYPWSFDPHVMAPLRTPTRPEPVEAPAMEVA